MSMHKEILDQNQIELLELVSKFSKKFGLVGGTAIALQIGHRKSIDFDLFAQETFQNSEIRKKINKKNFKIERIFLDEKDQFSFLLKSVQFTFLKFPFTIEFRKEFKNIRMPDLLTLAAMKAYALGRRAKWKDYVDLYFIMRDFYSLKEISKKAMKIFENEFNEKIFREQISYFSDIDYSEKIIFMNDFNISEKEIEQSLKKMAVK